MNWLVERGRVPRLLPGQVGKWVAPGEDGLQAGPGQNEFEFAPFRRCEDTRIVAEAQTEGEDAKRGRAGGAVFIEEVTRGREGEVGREPPVSAQLGLDGLLEGRQILGADNFRPGERKIGGGTEAGEAKGGNGFSGPFVAGFSEREGEESAMLLDQFEFAAEEPIGLLVRVSAAGRREAFEEGGLFAGRIFSGSEAAELRAQELEGRGVTDGFDPAHTKGGARLLEFGRVTAAGDSMADFVRLPLERGGGGRRRSRTAGGDGDCDSGQQGATL